MNWFALIVFAYTTTSASWLGAGPSSALGAGLPRPAGQNAPPLRAYSAAPDAVVRIWMPGGHLRVEGWSRDSVEVRANLAPGAGRLAAGGGRTALKIALDQVKDSAALSAAVIEVRVPRGAQVTIQGGNVDVDVSGMTGTLDGSLRAGRLRADGAFRTIRADVLDGNIELVGASSEIDARTGTGRVLVRGVTGDLRASSVSGTLLVGGASLRRARLESVTGEISVKGSVQHGGKLEVFSHSGDVELRLPPTLGADIDVTAPSGHFSSEFAVKGRPTLKTPLTATLGDGGSSIVVRTFKGRVSLAQQPEPDPNLNPPTGISGKPKS